MKEMNKKILCALIALAAAFSAVSCAADKETSAEGTDKGGLPVPGAKSGVTYTPNKDESNSPAAAPSQEGSGSSSDELFDEKPDADGDISSDDDAELEPSVNNKTETDTGTQTVTPVEPVVPVSPNNSDAKPEGNTDETTADKPAVPSSNEPEKAPEKLPETQPEKAPSGDAPAPVPAPAPAPVGSDAKQPENQPSAVPAGTSQTVAQPKRGAPAPADLSVEWNLILVNPWYTLPEDGYTFKQVTVEGSYIVDERICDDLQQMLSDMRKEGLHPAICSAYRTYARQTRNYNNQIQQYLNKGYSQAEAENEASKWVAVPGTSEHHTGLALDIVSNRNYNLDESQEKEPEQQWLMAHCHEYGFILRYPNGKTDITGIYYEPWHYRYVGKEVAAEIAKSGVTLEEYLGKVNPY